MDFEYSTNAKEISAMKAIVLFLLLAGYQCCFGQMDTNLIAVGDWSEPVRDRDGYTLRGRLLIYNGENNRPAKVYLEFHHLWTMVRYAPTQIYFSAYGLHLEMHNGFDKPIPSEAFGPVEVMPGSCWVTLPYDSAVRIRADPIYDPGSEKTNEISIILLDSAHKNKASESAESWIIRPGVTNDYYLSATYSSPTNRLGSLDYHVWQGTLNFPKVKIPAKKS
jgi:hypothetical protein